MQRLEEGLLYAAAIIVAVIWPAHSGDLINPGSDLDLTTFPARACMGGVVALATWPAREWLVGKGMRPSGAGILLALVIGILIIGPLILLAIEMARRSECCCRNGATTEGSWTGTPQWVPQIPFIGIYVASRWQDNLADADAAKSFWEKPNPWT